MPGAPRCPPPSTPGTGSTRRFRPRPLEKRGTYANQPHVQKLRAMQMILKGKAFPPRPSPGGGARRQRYVRQNILFG